MVVKCLTLNFCSFHHGSEVLPSESWYSGDKSPALLPALTPANLLLFPEVKTVFKGRHFQDTEDIKRDIITKFKALSSDAFNDCFTQL